jgi:hypothetical protein
MYSRIGYIYLPQADVTPPLSCASCSCAWQSAESRWQLRERDVRRRHLYVLAVL